ncbi:MAG: hypothetical protein P8Y00_03575 [Deltaproteobacteria bacterium]
MKILHILKSKPDDLTNTFIDLISDGEENTTFSLYEPDADYAKLLDLIFENDRTISWW